MQLVIANKNYSSWSMRPWVLMTHFGIPFKEEKILLAREETAAQIRQLSPSGRVPCLIDDAGCAVWDSLAIAETLAERFPQHALWPRDARARAHARSMAAEMHSSFTGVRGAMPMNIRGRADAGVGHTPEALADVARIAEMWGDALTRFGGPFLCGDFSIVDAMFAPVAMLFVSYHVRLPQAQQQTYLERLLAVPAVRAWIDAAHAEDVAIPQYDALLKTQ